jgi:anaerobic magnesium-protoporphyrin IX monomethyl ester cyclase
MQIERIVLVDLESELPHLGKLMGMPRFGLSVIGSVLAAAGYQVHTLADVYAPVTAEEILALAPDAVLWNGIDITLPRVRALAQAVRAKARRALFVLGGEVATLRPGVGLDFADVVVLHEGDKTILRLLQTAKADGDLASVPGILFCRDGKPVRTTPYGRQCCIDYRLDPSLYRGLDQVGRRTRPRRFAMWQGHLFTFPIQTSRGCDRACGFCTWPTLFGGKGYLERPVDDVVDDVERAVRHANLRNFMIVDNLFGRRREYALSLARALIERFPRRRPSFLALMRADQFGAGGYSLADVRLLRAAGFKDISLGLESVNPESLRRHRKGVSLNRYVQAIEMLHAAGVRPCGTFGVGGGEDTLADIDRIVDFAREMRLHRLHVYTYCLVPGAPAMERDGHLVIPAVEGKYLHGHAAIILPRRMLPSELQEAALSAMDRFYAWTTLEGFLYKKQIRAIRKSLAPHLARLRQLERALIARGTYVRKHGNWMLDEEKLTSQQVGELAA